MLLQNPDAILNRLEKLHPAQIDLSLDRILNLLDKLGNPQKKLPPVVHIAGTNGKGSTIAFLKAFLQAQGKKVHAYTSPHLVRFNERINLCGEDIADDALADVLREVEDAASGAPVTFFESTTAAAFLAFSRTPADVVLLETGLGGRLDATNVVDAPACVAITSLSMDHEALLGGTLAKIAGEKAAIIKKNRPVCASASPSEALNVLIETAAQKNAPLKIEGRDFFIEPADDGFSFNGAKLPKPALQGGHQLKNAGLALAVLEELQKQGIAAKDEESVKKGLKSVEWKARLQKTSCTKAGGLAQVWLDGGHNPGAAQVLADFLDSWRDKPLYAVCGMISSKDAAGYLNKVTPFVKGAVFVPVPHGTAPTHDPELLARIARENGVEYVRTAPDTDTALAMLKERISAPSRVLVCGSLYLAGEFLKTLG